MDLGVDLGVPLQLGATPSWSGNANLQWGKERGQLIDLGLLTAYLLAHLAATLLRVYPIAIGLRPPDFLESAMRLHQTIWVSPPPGKPHKAR